VADTFGSSLVPVTEALRREWVAIIGSWGERCEQDTVLTAGDMFPPVDEVLEAVAIALGRPQPVEAGADEVVPRTATLFADIDSPVTVAARQLLHLEDSILDFIPSLPSDETLEVHSRAHSVMTWLVTHIAATRLRTIALDAQRHDLTGMWSKIRFRQDIAAARDEFSDDGSPIWLVAIDLDGFKTINDTLGHEGGDEVLREFGAALVDSVGAYGTAYHLSGDEFGLILRGGDAHAICERAAAIADVSCSHGDVRLTRETVLLTEEELHDAADQELLRSKHAKKRWWTRMMITICGGRR
jgi:diguanylate cyclase (GGDEF)-like protein